MIKEYQSGDNLFFTSDHHFGHANIIEYCNRPFADIDDMNNELIKRWNEVVPEDGIAYHLGDFCLGDNAREFYSLPNGNINILCVPWHHDRRWLGSIKSIFNPSTATRVVHRLNMEAVIKVGEQFVHMSHYPLGEWDRKHYGAWHLHGHSHGNYKGDLHNTGLPCVDVGVDMWHWCPATWQQIVDAITDDGNLKGDA